MRRAAWASRIPDPSIAAPCVAWASRIPDPSIAARRAAWASRIPDPSIAAPCAAWAWRIPDPLIAARALASRAVPRRAGPIAGLASPAAPSRILLETASFAARGEAGAAVSPAPGGPSERSRARRRTAPAPARPRMLARRPSWCRAALPAPRRRGPRGGSAAWGRARGLRPSWIRGRARASGAPARALVAGQEGPSSRPHRRAAACIGPTACPRGKATRAFPSAKGRPALAAGPGRGGPHRDRPDRLRAPYEEGARRAVRRRRAPPSRGSSRCPPRPRIHAGWRRS